MISHVVHFHDTRPDLLNSVDLPVASFGYWSDTQCPSFTGFKNIQNYLHVGMLHVFSSIIRSDSSYSVLREQLELISYEYHGTPSTAWLARLAPHDLSYLFAYY